MKHLRVDEFNELHAEAEGRSFCCRVWLRGRLHRVISQCGKLTRQEYRL